MLEKLLLLVYIYIEIKYQRSMDKSILFENSLKERERWEEFISKVIHEQLIPKEQGGWFLICYQQLKEDVTKIVYPDFREYYCAYYSVLADFINNREGCLTFAMIVSFSDYWPYEIHPQSLNNSFEDNRVLFPH